MGCGKLKYTRGHCHVLSAGARFSKIPKRFGPEKTFIKLRPAYSVKLVFSYIVKGIKIIIPVKVRASRRLRFEDTKRSELRHPKCARKISGLSRNGPQE